jgi:hypothetical protein
MNLRKKARQLPLRLAAGSFVISSGLSMWGADEATAKHLEGFAAGTYPFLASSTRGCSPRHYPPVSLPSEPRCCCHSCPPASPGQR